LLKYDLRIFDVNVEENNILIPNGQTTSSIHSFSSVKPKTIKPLTVK
jgi:hypothetical protein